MRTSRCGRNEHATRRNGGDLIVGYYSTGINRPTGQGRAQTLEGELYRALIDRSKIARGFERREARKKRADGTPSTGVREATTNRIASRRSLATPVTGEKTLHRCYALTDLRISGIIADATNETDAARKRVRSIAFSPIRPRWEKPFLGFPREFFRAVLFSGIRPGE